jgi:hypothetical protein
MVTESAMQKALREAALLRNKIETCLKAAAAPMTGREVAAYSGIPELIGKAEWAYGKVSAQLTNMYKKKLIERIGSGAAVTYRWIPTVVKVEAKSQVPELHLRVDKANRTISLQFEGLNITIEVAK